MPAAVQAASLQDWIRDHRCKADDAIRAIAGAKKQRVSEYDERLRKLKSFAEILYVRQADVSQGELFKPAEILNPALAELIENPLLGLD